MVDSTKRLVEASRRQAEECSLEALAARVGALELVLDLVPDELVGVVARRLDDLGDRVSSLESSRRLISASRFRRDEAAALLGERIEALESNDVTRDYIDDAIQRYDDLEQARLLRLEDASGLIEQRLLLCEQRRAELEQRVERLESVEED